MVRMGPATPLGSQNAKVFTGVHGTGLFPLNPARRVKSGVKVLCGLIHSQRLPASGPATTQQQTGKGERQLCHGVYLRRICPLR